MSGSDDQVASRSQVVIGMDPHKRSVTIEVMTGVEEIVGGGRFGTDGAGFADLLRCAQEWPERVWAVEGCNGIGRHVATRLVEAGERVIDVPPKLSARVRIFATGQGRKTDATDAHSIALVGVRMSGLAPVVRDEQREVRGCWSTGDDASVRNTPSRHASCILCSWNSSLVGRRRTRPLRRPGPRSRGRPRRRRRSARPGRRPAGLEASVQCRSLIGRWFDPRHVPT